MTAITQIIDWINEDSRPIFWKHAIRLLLLESKLENIHYDLLFDIAKKEAGFIVDIQDLDLYKEIISSDGFKIEDEPVYLLGLGPVTNVSSIEDDQMITFQKNGMTVIYGDNGTGKSSYAKILKNACLTRGEKPELIGNIFDSNSDIPSSKICYQVGDNNKNEVDWTYKKTEISDLKSIRVFDTKSAFHYVEKEDALDYRPAGLHLLDELTNVCSFIQSKVEAQIAKFSNEIELPKVEKETNACNFLVGIGVDTTKADLERYCIKEDEKKQLENLKKEIGDLKSKTVDELKKTIEKKILLYKPLLNSLTAAFNMVSDDSIGAIGKIKKDFESKTNASALVRKSTFSELPMSNIGSPVWQSLWTSAKKFINSLDETLSFPPKEDEICPLCLQSITENTATQMMAFEKFIQDDAQKQAEKAKKQYEEKIESVENSKIALESYGAALLDLKELSIDIDHRIAEFIKTYNTRKEYILNQKNNLNDLSSIPNLDNTLLTFIDDVIKTKEEELKQIKEPEDIKKLIKNKELLANEFTAKSIIKDCRTQVESEIKRIKSLSAYKTIKTKTNTRQISQLSTTISSVYLTSSLKDHFSNEIKKLGFNYFQVNASTRSQKGSQLFGIELTNNSNTKVHTIASEGEQKCLAIASVFAEFNSDGRRSCVVFDDPVNSLDHRWRAKVAARLIDASTERQVIVFTHDIVFLKLLLEAAEYKPTSNIDVKSLDRRLKYTGIVRANPPWDALTTSKRIKFLNNEFRKIKKIEREGTESEYSDAVSSFYGLLREAWERLVEEKLLNKVVERFGRAVQTQRLKRLVDISDKDIEIIDTEMGKCSSLFKGHDAAPDLSESMPSIDEIQQDLNTIKGFEQELSQNRKRS